MLRIAPLVLLAACTSGMLHMREESPGGAGTLRAAVLYVDSDNGDRGTADAARRVLAENWSRVEPLVRMAARAGAQVIVTPEYINTGHSIEQEACEHVCTRVPWPPERTPLHESRDPAVREYLRAYSRLSAELDAFLVTTAFERAGDRYYNTMVAFDPAGRLVGRYRKNNLWLGEHDVAVEGDETAAFDTPYGRFGMLICYDLVKQTLIDRTMDEQDVDYFVVCSNWAKVPWPGPWASSLCAQRTGRAVLWANQYSPGLAGGMGVFRPDAPNTSRGLFGEPGVIVANLRIPARLRR